MITLGIGVDFVQVEKTTFNKQSEIDEFVRRLYCAAQAVWPDDPDFAEVQPYIPTKDELAEEVPAKGLLKKPKTRAATDIEAAA